MIIAGIPLCHHLILTHVGMFLEFLNKACKWLIGN